MGFSDRLLGVSWTVSKWRAVSPSKKRDEAIRTFKKANGRGDDGTGKGGNVFKREEGNGQPWLINEKYHNLRTEIQFSPHGYPGRRRVR